MVRTDPVSIGGKLLVMLFLLSMTSWSACELGGGGTKDTGGPGEDVSLPNPEPDAATDGGEPVPDGTVEPDLPAVPDSLPPDSTPPEPCGNGVCDVGEDPCTCPADCKAPDHCCSDAECPQPQCGPCCKAQCVEGKCGDVWLDDCCWNGKCEEGESFANCPEDCPKEPECTKDADCPQPKCGPCCKGLCIEGQCEEVWLDNCCWNGKCEEGENPLNCPQDCPGDLTECVKAGGICAPWDPQYSKCPPGTKPTGLACKTKSEVCCQKEGTPPDNCDSNPFACKADDECVKTNAGCCPCNSGGKSIAVSKACEAAWLKSLNCPPDIMCPMVYLCDDSVPACKDGKCTLVAPAAPK